MKAKLQRVSYWLMTAPLALAFLAGGIGDFFPQVAEQMVHLGYPAYFAKILGVWKLAGVVAILIPRFPRLKEWAYAGMIFDLTGAAVSHAAVGDATAYVIRPLFLCVFVAASWAMRPADRKLAAAAAAAPAEPAPAPQPK